MAVHVRPPNLGTANVYGIRRVEPIRFGTAVSQNCSGSVSVIPMLPRLITTIVHSTQMLKPRFSAKIESARFFRATRLPVCSQNCSSSGFQSSIHRPCCVLIREPPPSVVGEMPPGHPRLSSRPRAGFLHVVYAPTRGDRNPPASGEVASDGP